MSHLLQVLSCRVARSSQCELSGGSQRLAGDGMIMLFVKERGDGRRGARAPLSELLPSGLEMTDWLLER